MTVIVWDGKTLAADRQMTNNGLARPVTKAWRLQRPGQEYHELVAITGDLSVGMRLKSWWERGGSETTWPTEMDKGDSHLIVVSRSGIQVYETSPYPICIEAGQMAWGSGRDYALGAMEMGASARKAVEVASTLDLWCGCGVIELTLEAQ